MNKYLFIALLFALASCEGSRDNKPDNTLDASEVADFDKYYKPAEFASMDMLSRDARWSWWRSRQSEHFVVFWESGFGTDPNAATVDAALRVDIDDLLQRAERFYTTNVETLRFAEVGSGRSQLDRYKLQIYLLYQKEWLATGAGYDDVIGALWVNPSTCQPAGSTIAHEIGHSFQYQVYCDMLLMGAPGDFRRGWRYGFGAGGSGGNGFWEQCAQWQSFQDYPGEMFAQADVWLANCHRPFTHEWMRYQSHWLHYYWAARHGIGVVSELWHESVAPEDPVQTYMRLHCGGSVDALYAELYDYAARMATYDIEGIKLYTTAAARRYTTPLIEVGDDEWQVAYAGTPGTGGFNVIELSVPTAGTEVQAHFTGLTPGSALAEGDPGQYKVNEAVAGRRTTYNTSDNTPGWRYGFVARTGGTAHYGAMCSEGTATLTVPAGCTNLYLVVMGAPGEYRAHAWDDDESNDEQWPYRVRLDGTRPR
jgi:hypothetical protein